MEWENRGSNNGITGERREPEKEGGRYSPRRKVPSNFSTVVMPVVLKAGYPSFESVQFHTFLVQLVAQFVDLSLLRRRRLCL